MKEKRLKHLIKAMYLRREILTTKKESDFVFEHTNKSQKINEVSELIDLSLEEFYSCRAEQY